MAAAIGDHISTARGYGIPFAGYTIMAMYALCVLWPSLLSPFWGSYRASGTNSEFFRSSVAWSSTKHGKVASGYAQSMRLRTVGSMVGPLWTERTRTPTSTRREARSSLRPSSHSHSGVQLPISHRCCPLFKSPLYVLRTVVYLYHSIPWLVYVYDSSWNVLR